MFLLSSYQVLLAKAYILIATHYSNLESDRTVKVLFHGVVQHTIALECNY